MKDFLLFMHDNVSSEPAREKGQAWAAYFSTLRASGCFSGGSSIGEGICVRKSGEPGQITPRLTGYIRVQAESIEAARLLLDGNPVYESGGTIEIRELPRDAP